jgi:hypothetical protein
MMAPGLRKLALTAHVTCSVGWLGAVAGFLALAVAGLTPRELHTLRASYIAMDLIGWYVIVPLCFASLVTGLIQALGTPWGLFRHYWVVAKLLIAIVATIVLLVHMQPISALGRAAAERTLGLGDFRDVRIQLVADAGAALLVLIVATTFSIYKPRGLTRYGWRKQREQRRTTPESATKEARSSRLIAE